jgi:Flp pilus assembly protein TadB
VNVAADAGDAWDQAEPPLLRMLLKVLLYVAVVAASPFLMLSFLFFLLAKPLLWIVLPLTIAASILACGFVVWLVVRVRLRAYRETLRRLS